VVCTISGSKISEFEVSAEDIVAGTSATSIEQTSPWKW